MPKHEALMTISLKEWSCLWKKKIIYSDSATREMAGTSRREREEETDEAAAFSPEACWKL